MRFRREINLFDHSARCFTPFANIQAITSTPLPGASAPSSALMPSSGVAAALAYSRRQFLRCHIWYVMRWRKPLIGRRTPGWPGPVTRPDYLGFANI